ncbi:uncharacterized protein [Apostichopus japonicus]|uniref:uncharacterized protein isoform X2 n=1 Tax=Stichopus japonicus TaxID=307972 RepID=UPI003AB4BCF4
MLYFKMSITNLFTIPAILWFILSGTVVALDKCQSPQYLLLGKKGMISCNHPGDLYAAVWSNSTNVTSNGGPFISLRDGIISGPGHESGEYDVEPNGSLIINKVSTKDNHFFGVTILATLDEDPTFQAVRVVVYEKPHEPYPIIDTTGCDQKSLCFLELNADASLSCNVLQVGEVLDDLSWKLRTSSGDEHISSQSKSVTTSVNELQSYHTVVDISLKPSLSLRVFVCAARSDVSQVGNTESTILVESGTLEASSEPLIVTPNERVVMDCGEGVSFFVWKKVGQTEEIIAFGTKSLSEVMMPNGFTLQNSSLVINTVGNPTLGTYTCVYSTDGVTTKLISTDVTFQETNSKAPFKKVIISKDQSRDVHDGTVKNLKEASKRQVDIQKIILRDSFTSVEDNGVAINLSSGAVLPPLNTLNRLDFENEKWQQWDLTKLISILTYACHRSPPTEIKIERIMLPFEFGNKLITLQQKPYVVWQTGVGHAGVLHLDYETGQWKNTSQVPLNEKVYIMLLKKFEEEKAKEEMTNQTEGAKLLEDSDHKQSPSDVKV